MDTLLTPPAISVLLAVLLVGSLAVGTWQDWRRSIRFAAAFADSFLGTLSFMQKPNWRGFVCQLRPPPEPFIHSTITFEPRSNFSWNSWIMRLWMGEVDAMKIVAVVDQLPGAELRWRLGNEPDVAATSTPSEVLWQHRTLDINQATYAVRGLNTNGIEKAFRDMQARFGPLLREITIIEAMNQRMRPTPCTRLFIELQTTQLDEKEIPALLVAIRSLGRASQIS